MPDGAVVGRLDAVGDFSPALLSPKALELNGKVTACPGGGRTPASDRVCP